MILKITLKDGERLDCIAETIHTYKQRIIALDNKARCVRTIPLYAIKSMYYNINEHDDKEICSIEIYTLKCDHIIETQCYINLFNNAINIYDLCGDLIYVIPMSDVKSFFCKPSRKS